MAVAMLAALGVTSFAETKMINNNTSAERPTIWIFDGTNSWGDVTNYGLNVYGSNTIAQNRNVTVWSGPATSAQTWYYEQFSDGQSRLVSALGSKKYALNRNRYQAYYNNCDVMLWSTNLTDSALTSSNSPTGGANTFTMTYSPNTNYQLYHGDNDYNGANVTWRHNPNGQHQWHRGSA